MERVSAYLLAGDEPPLAAHTEQSGEGEPGGCWVVELSLGHHSEHSLKVGREEVMTENKGAMLRRIWPEVSGTSLTCAVGAILPKAVLAPRREVDSWKRAARYKRLREL